MRNPEIHRGNIYIELATWQEFRIACMLRRMSVSKVLRQLMHAQLQQWKEESHEQTTEIDEHTH